MVKEFFILILGFEILTKQEGFSVEGQPPTVQIEQVGIGPDGQVGGVPK